MRKKFKYLLLCFICFPAIAAAQFTDDFTDGDFTNNPAWNGDTAKFEIVIAPNMLHLNAPALDEDAYLATASQAIENAVWEFYLELSFNPSGSNYAKVYLVSDQETLNIALNGYFVKIGNTADEVSLYRQDGLSETLILDGTDGVVNLALVNIRIRVTRDSIGNWELLHDASGGFTFTSEGTVNDNTYPSTSYFGVYCDYTSTRSDRFWFDDFVVSGNPYSGPFYDTAAYREVLINEIMADPSPQVGLPDAEYVELINPTQSDTFNLSGWTFSDGGSPAALGSYELAPGEYVVLCNMTDTALFSAFYPRVLGVSSFPALNNAGDALEIKNQLGALIDSVTYSDNWYNDNTKDDGGWSLELINPQAICSGAYNWTASNDASGGTPGKENSVYDITPDTQGPVLLSAEVIDAASVLLTFDEPIDSGSMSLGSWSVTNGLSVAIATLIPLANVQVSITLASPMDTGIVYTITVGGLTDCPGNAVTQGSGNFMLPAQGLPGDLLINEVLFDPVTGGQDFVEVYNNSRKIISLKDWKLANFDNDTIDNFKDIITTPLMMMPGEFIVITKDSANIKKEYPLARAGGFIEITSQPNYNNDSSTVYLISNKNTVVDKFSYTDEMHFALLNEVEGISLERIDYDRPASDATNWHSAAENVGFATPGYENSQYNPANETTKEVTINPEIFSPDNDGLNDVVNISYDFDEPGFVANITIYDAKGRLVKYLVKNELLGMEGAFSWDGFNENNEKARIGIYIIFFEAFNLEGEVQKFKKTCVLAAQL